MRNVVVKLNERGDKLNKIEATTGMPYQAIRSIIRTKQKENRSNKKPKGGNHKPTIAESMQSYIIQLQDADSTIRLRDIQ